LAISRYCCGIFSLPAIAKNGNCKCSISRGLYNDDVCSYNTHFPIACVAGTRGTTRIISHTCIIVPCEKTIHRDATMLFRGAAVTLVLLVQASPWALAQAAETFVTTESLAQNLARLESVREIKNIQRTFAQLAHYGRFKEMASFFADNGVFRWGSGKGSNILDDSDATSIVGPAAVETWLRNDSGKMDGIQPGSMNAMINEMPLVTLSSDGKTAKGRWHCLRYMGDGVGGSRIEGGIFENQYTLVGERWKISLLRYYPLYAGNYRDGWKNVEGKALPIVPYHYTPDEAGIPILNLDQATTNSTRPTKRVTTTTASLDSDELVYRISQLNEEDEVRNLVHSTGYYVDQRMWPDVLDLFTPDGTITVDNNTSPAGRSGLQQVLDRMGPEGITKGILNDHPIYQTTVQMGADGLSAVARGLEIGMIGDSNARTAQWQFCTFRHTLVRDPDTAIWKIAKLNYSRLIFADYAIGWEKGGLLAPKPFPPGPTPPEFLVSILNLSSSAPRRPVNWRPLLREGVHPTSSLLPDLERRLLRSAAFDETEHISSAYGHYIDDVRCNLFAELHAQGGFKSSPGIGWYRGPSRIATACSTRYGPNTSSLSPPPRASIPFHWRIQPVILVSHDGKSSTLRSRNLQTGTGQNSTAGFSNLAGINGGIYHDQFVLEKANSTTRRKIWCLTIDEFYWSSGSWGTGWANVNRTSSISKREPASGYLEPRQMGSLDNFPPDLSIKDPKFGNRYQGFMGGPPPSISWPNILQMWWEYRNPVTGRVPASYWGPGCVPCRNGIRPEWALTENGYEEPSTGPTVITVNATISRSTTEEGRDVVIVITSVKSGPEEQVWGYVELRKGNRSANLMGETLLDNEGVATFVVPKGDLTPGANALAVYYAGNDRVKPGKGVVVVNI